MIEAIAALVPWLLAALYGFLYWQSQRLLRRAWDREYEYGCIINDLAALAGSSPLREKDATDGC